VNRITAFILAALTGIAAHAQKKPVTIEAILAEQPDRGFGAVQWAPDGKRFAWIEKKELQLYDIPSRQQKVLLNLADLESKAVRPSLSEGFDWKNRRVSEQSLAWSDSGADILVSSGADLFLVHLKTGKWDQLTATPEVERDPKLSPGGRYISFRREHDLYTLEISTGKTVRLTSDGSETLLNAELDWVYPEELEIGTAHWWSPDGKLIAFLQFDVGREPIFPQADLLSVRARFEPERYPKAGDPNADVRLGIVAVGGGPTRWMDLGETRDNLLARVVWLPDSRQIAAERLNRVQNRLDLLIANVATGESHAVLHEEDPAWVNVNDDLVFLKDKFLWGSERDGFHHLYLYSIEGKRLRQLTKGEWVVDKVVGVDEAAGEAYFTSTQSSPLERQLYAVRLDGTDQRRLSAEPGTHAISMGPDCAFYLDTASNLTSPRRRTIHRNDGSETTVFREADRTLNNEYDILPTETHQVRTPDGVVLYGRLIKPAGFIAGKKYPIIVFIYGGPQAGQAVANAWPGLHWDQVLAHRGFVIWQLDNRGTWGRGHRWESVIFHNMGVHELEDQKEGIRYLQSLGFADTSRMGIYGWSYGGYMTLYTLTHAPGLFRAGIAGAPVTHWRNYDTIYTERYMGMPEENASGYESASALTHAADLKDKLLIIHNLEDDNVHFQNAVQFMDALEQADKPFELMLYPQKQHGVEGALRKHLYGTMVEFFEKNVK
jgi:dipeptidyl-peptidase-4